VVPFPDKHDDAQGTEFEPYYVEHREFNDALDSSYATIVIAGHSFPPSRVLYAVDPRAYRAALLEYQQQVQDDLKELVISRFPTPIAHHLHKVEHGCATYSARLSTLKDVWEAVILVLYAIVIGEFRCQSVPLLGAQIITPPKKEKLKFDHLFSNRLGTRIGIMIGLLQEALDHNLDIISRQLITLETLEKVRRLNQVRNGFAHDETKSEEQSREIFLTSYGEVMDILKQTQQLANMSLLRFDGTDGNALHVRFEQFVGYAINRRYKKVTLSAVQYSQCLGYLNADNILAHYKDRIFSTSPFLYFVTRDEGHITKLCLYRFRKGEGPEQALYFGVSGESKNKDFPVAEYFPTEVSGLESLFAAHTAGYGGS
jgi:hypothetical protein